jgi:hypothetical protein
MADLKFTLIGDGSSDVILKPIIEWLINDLHPQIPITGQFADFRRLPKPPQKADIVAQTNFARELYPFDILFFHRDGETNTADIITKRKKEVLEKVEGLLEAHRVVCIVPVVMTEAWLLIDEDAIKKAAGNRNYSGPMKLPALARLEDQTDPKETLFELLRTASGLKKRSLARFNVHQAVHRVAENIIDFSPLRSLPSFEAFEEDLKVALNHYLAQ